MGEGGLWRGSRILGMDCRYLRGWGEKCGSRDDAFLVGVVDI